MTLTPPKCLTGDAPHCETCIAMNYDYCCECGEYWGGMNTTKVRSI